ncbi:MAG: dTMP kinase, partial [Candidatus Poseidoniia archaeon]
QARRLVAWLRERGRSASETCAPPRGPWGRRVREWLGGGLEASEREVLEMFVNDRAEHVEQLILPALARGEIVVCDRYQASTRAYQVAQGVDRALVSRLLDTRGFRDPDLTLWLRVPVEVAMLRMGSSATERFEKSEFLTRVDAEYARLALVSVDGGGSVDAVQA